MNGTGHLFHLFSLSKSKVIILPLLLIIVYTDCQNTTKHDVRKQSSNRQQQNNQKFNYFVKPEQISENCKCGQINDPQSREGRIINGAEVKPPYKYPWMAVVLKGTQVICGGSLINSKFVLTATQCVSENPSMYEVLVGVHNIDNIGNSGRVTIPGEPFIQRRSIANIIVYPGGRGRQVLSHSPALIELSTPVIFTKEVSPACLPPYNREYSQPAREGIIMGWGTTELTYQSNILKEAVVKVIGHHQCRDLSSIYPRWLLHDDSICAWAPGKNICLGDAGGPLIVKSSTSYTQIGVALGGFFCDQDKFPGIFLSVSSLPGWIYESTKGAVYCRNPDSGF